MPCRELNARFVSGVVLVYGLSQGFMGSFIRVETDYYWKDVQKVQPSKVQMYTGLYFIPWIFLLMSSLCLDITHRPYFALAGILGASTALIVSMNGKLPIVMVQLCLFGIAGAVAIADVTIDACITRNSIEWFLLAPDMHSLCGYISSVGALIGYLSSGVFVHTLEAQGALGMMAIPPASLVLLGFVIFELRTKHLSEKKKVMEKVSRAVRGMGSTIKCPQMLKPSLNMFLSLGLSISTHEGHFYWYTGSKAGPAFSQEIVGIIYAIGAMASIFGVLIYHKLLKDCPFRSLLFYAQLLYGASGMLDLIFVLRWNVNLGVPGYIFVVLEECCTRIVSKIRLMLMIVLGTKLCPLGIGGLSVRFLCALIALGFFVQRLRDVQVYICFMLQELIS